LADMMCPTAFVSRLLVRFPTLTADTGCATG
jgi:hypothetical protein